VIPDVARPPKLYMVTVPGLRVTSDFSVVHDRLLDDFPGIRDVLPTTIKATLLIVYVGRANLEAWLERAGDAVRWRSQRAGNG
jgi:hypothetical protein